GSCIVALPAGAIFQCGAAPRAGRARAQPEDTPAGGLGMQATILRAPRCDDLYGDLSIRHEILDLSFEDDHIVAALQMYRDGWVQRQIARPSRSGQSVEIERLIHPDAPDRRHMRPPVWSRRR